MAARQARRWFGRASWICIAAIWLASGVGEAAAQSETPRTLDECYLKVALEKSTPDLLYLARETCDAVFRAVPRSIATFDADTGRCDEWWFDANGRYETEAYYCSLEPTTEPAGGWKLACQWKAPNPKRYLFAKLRETNGRLETVGGVQGHSIGPLFSGLAACVEDRARRDAAP